MAAKGSSFQITATPVTLFAHLLLIAVTTLVLVWLLHFQGGLAFKSGDNDKIFNVISSLKCSYIRNACFYVFEVIVRFPFLTVCFALFYSCTRF